VFCANESVFCARYSHEKIQNWGLKIEN
jgi:hypothetical protein